MSMYGEAMALRARARAGDNRMALARQQQQMQAMQQLGQAMQQAKAEKAAKEEKAARAADLRKTLSDEEYQPQFEESMTAREQRDLNQARIESMKQSNEIAKAKQAQEKLKLEQARLRESFEESRKAYEAKKAQDEKTRINEDILRAQRGALGVSTAMPGDLAGPMGGIAGNAARGTGLGLQTKEGLEIALKARAEDRKYRMEQAKETRAAAPKQPDPETAAEAALRRQRDAQTALIQKKIEGMDIKTYMGVRRQASIDVGRAMGMNKQDSMSALMAVINGQDPTAILGGKERVDEFMRRLEARAQEIQYGIGSGTPPPPPPPPPDDVEPDDALVEDLMKQYGVGSGGR